ncbi:hypothetical protein BD309DRAFT_967500 [Dichomitus squalens]|uniref:Uncharacterized protein n=2 Tax=Dichomitus squalens TaxID=114155 RepID=A0A4Q9PH25_9APHY|nr:hypothetical protein BD309DRAFT_967500 [Dichomitus squalens]TBU52641.1 hypothetical protein BD310DRAFT_981704 [Dichomitus squalens]
MESLNLNNLASSLPSSSYANAEKELTNNFRAAALSLTTLFRSSKTASKRAYNAGYAAACHDLLNMIQQGVSTDADPSREVTIGRIMDYIEARLEAIRAREEEEDEEEEKERVAKGGPAPVPGPSGTTSFKPVAKPSTPTAPSIPLRRDQQPVAPPTPYTPSTMEGQRPYVAHALASPTPSTLSLRPAFTTAMQSLSRAPLSKSRLSVNPKDLSSLPLPAAPMSFTFQPPAVAEVSINPDSELLSFPAAAASTPLKRRREAMSADSPASANADGATGGSAGTSTSRRRTRSWRGDQAQHQHRADNHGEAMEVEEEGPQRKRVARR